MLIPFLHSFTYLPTLNLIAFEPMMKSQNVIVSTVELKQVDASLVSNRGGEGHEMEKNCGSNLSHGFSCF